MSRPFIRGQVAIDSMRDNGFLSAAHALAELIDNSIQAGADSVELIAYEKTKKTSKRSIKQIEKIGVLDNGCGMSQDTLHLALEFGASENRNDSKGIGKFGMGLPNSSISQCKRVDVWSWTDKANVLHTYLDIDEIKEGALETIPVPSRSELPDEMKIACDEIVPESGTFVLWSKIDRCRWKTGKTIYKHTDKIVGRMYRNFLHKNSVGIKYKCFERKDSIFVGSDEKTFKPNDPLYLMKDTSLSNLPGEFKGESMFELVDNCVFTKTLNDENGELQEVVITGTVLKRSVLQSMRATLDGYVGSTIWGKHAAGNLGLSVVRSGRELSLLPGFVKAGYADKGRWYGIQLEFSPALDNVFGVTNNKQHVVNLEFNDVIEDAIAAGYETEQEYRSELIANDDIKLRIYNVVQWLREVEKELIAVIDGYNLKGAKSASKNNTENNEFTSGPVGTINEKEREREKDHPTQPSTITTEEVEKVLTDIGADKAPEKAETILANKLHVWVEEVPMATSAFFDVSTKKGFTLLQINSNHVFTAEILKKIPADKREAIEICLAGWARMERECLSERRLNQLVMARKDWGQLLEDYLDPIDVDEQL